MISITLTKPLRVLSYTNFMTLVRNHSYLNKHHTDLNPVYRQDLDFCAVRLWENFGEQQFHRLYAYCSKAKKWIYGLAAGR